ncbi:oocyte zinc finger protein XlCOF6-like isoform X3 [Sebastes umbrosus]|uniref:oocyte zinc finger protein XlCOF6-like isoform X3 n=1 Tax=Sebastes umbrosus TaxID=72105 RepID=UPI00189EFD53|nr:oocyte zinc finger protein XlCOF6-like isoform X3 [Sebastes umbrosus]
MDRHRKQLEVVLKPEAKPRGEVLPSDVRKVIVGEEEQQDWSSSLVQEDPEPPHIKEEQEELLTSQEGEQLQGLEEADITKFPFTPVPVKSEDDEQKPQSSQLHQRQTEQMETEADGGNSGGPEPARNSDPGRLPEPMYIIINYVVPVTDSRCSSGEKPFSCSECGKRFAIKKNLKQHMITHTGEKPFSCSLCTKSFKRSGDLQKHMRVHTGEKPFSCSVCMKSFARSEYLKKHLRIHTGQKPFNCWICDKRFLCKTHLERHIETHTGEKPFICSLCGKRLTVRATIKYHMAAHRGEKRYSCSVCDKRFAWRRQIKTHKCVGRQSSQLHQSQTEENREAEPPASSSTVQMETEADGEDYGGPEPARNSEPDGHPDPDTVDKTGDSSEAETDDSDDWKETREPQSGLNSLNNDEVPDSDSRCSAGEKTFSCSECDKRFGLKRNLKRHMRTHTGEKPFSCSICMKTFARRGDLQVHMRIHTGEKPFSCSLCDKSFTQSVHLQSHMKIHTVA